MTNADSCQAFRRSVKASRSRTAKQHAHENQQALEGLGQAIDIAERYEISIEVLKPKRDTYHVVFRQRIGKSNFAVARWWPSTHLLKVGSIASRPATIIEALKNVIGALEIGEVK